MIEQRRTDTSSGSADGGYEYQGLAIRVRTTDSADLAWLDEFLAPAFQPGPDRTGDWSVALSNDAGRYVELLRGRPLAPEKADVFTLDRRMIRLPQWWTAAGDRALFDRGFRAFYVLPHDRAEIGILTPQGNRAARIGLMRVVRELAMTRAWNAGGLVVHGAAFAVGDRGVLIGGARKAGKTTLLTHMLMAAAARFIANDRVVVTGPAGGARLRGMPTIVTLRPGMLRRFPRLRDRLAASGYHHFLTLREADGRPPGSITPARDGRFSITPAQYCGLVGAVPSLDAGLAAAVFPTVTGRDGGIELVRLSAEHAAARLRGTLFRGDAVRRTSPVFDPDAGPAAARHETIAATCAALGETVACYDCRLGRQAYRDAHSVDDVLLRLLG